MCRYRNAIQRHSGEQRLRCLLGKRQRVCRLSCGRARGRTCLTLLVASVLLPLAQADMTPQQIPGVYTLIPTTSGATSCPPGLSVMQVNVVSTSTGTIFAIPGQNISISNRFPNDPGLRCSQVPVAGTEGVPVASTVLRTMDQVAPDTRSDILNRFYASKERFYLGYEVGDRVCGSQALPSGTVSLWAVPNVDVRATDNGVTITFKANTKYLYYFSETAPCLYTANAAAVGRVVQQDGTASAGAGAPASPQTSFPAAGAGSTGHPAATYPSQTPCDPCAPRGGPGASPPPQQTVSPNATQARAECLPGTAQLTLRSGRSIPVSDVRVGDEVLVGRDDASGEPVYSPVFLFSHADARGSSRTPLVSLTTMSNRTVTVTAGHLVRLAGDARGCSGIAKSTTREEEGRLTPAGSVRVGDALVDGATGAPTRVVAIGRGGIHASGDHYNHYSGGGGRGARGGRGLYNPHTLHGDVVVDGIVVSCYTTAVHPRVAHALLAVPRLAYTRLGLRLDGQFVLRFFGLFHSARPAYGSRMILDLVKAL